MVLHCHAHLFACWLRHIYSQMLCLAINIVIVLLYTWWDGTVIDTATRKRVERLVRIFIPLRALLYFIQQIVDINIFVTVMV